MQMDESQCQNFWATNSEFWFIPVPFVGSEKREAKIGVLERSQKSALVIVRRGWWGWLADTWRERRLLGGGPTLC